MPNKLHSASEDEPVVLRENEAEHEKELEEYKNLIQSLGYAKFDN